jgi:hypothetical protein
MSTELYILTASVPTLPRIQRLLKVLFPRVKRLGSEADHWPPITADVEKTFISTARVFSRDSPRTVAQWTGRPIRES